MENGIEVTEISLFTGSSELLGGRVKTLHSKIYAGILATESERDNEEMKRNEYCYIDYVVCNLYPFEKCVSGGASHDDVIENIDIGGIFVCCVII